MSLLTITRRILGSIITPFRALSNNAGHVLKDIGSIKCNAFVRTRRQSTIRFRRGSCRQMCGSCQNPIKGVYFHVKPISAITSQCVSCRHSSQYTTPKTRYSGFPGMEKKKFYPMETQWRLYAQSKEPGSPDLRKDGTISGVGIRKIDITNERGFFPKTSRARIEQIKQMLRNKDMLKGDVGKKEPK